MALSGRRAGFRALSTLALAVALAIPVAGCGGSPGGSSDGSAGSGTSGDTGLSAALGRVADVASTRDSDVDYSDTGALVPLAGRDVESIVGFAILRALGAQTEADLGSLLQSDTGINVFNENYSISVGGLTLMAGGQDGALVKNRVTGLGWRDEGGTLVLPPAKYGGLPQLYQDMSEIQPRGADLAIGEPGDDLGQIGSPRGATLAGNPLFSALASCLGDVAAASILVHPLNVRSKSLGGRGPVAVAVGVLRPDSNAAIPEAVTCAAWGSAGAAGQYVRDLKNALASGRSLINLKPYSAMLPYSSVAEIGGTQHVVRWQASTPGSANLVFELIDTESLPALQDCGLVSPVVLSANHVAGCVAAH